jgi:hypothetical protein
VNPADATDTPRTSACGFSIDRMKIEQLQSNAHIANMTNRMPGHRASAMPDAKCSTTLRMARAGVNDA